MKPRFRLKRSADFKRVRQLGKSFAHPLLVLIAHPNGMEYSRFGVSAGRSIGDAVKRNHSKRLIRAALHPIWQSIKPGWDIVLLARSPMAQASYHATSNALRNLVERAELVWKEHVNGTTR